MWVYKKGENEMNNEILEMVTQALTESRLNGVLDCDEEYQTAKIHELVAHDKLKETLSDQQKELLENFTTAVYLPKLIRSRAGEHSAL